jgi:signal transduction histidine kinase
MFDINSQAGQVSLVMTFRFRQSQSAPRGLPAGLSLAIGLLWVAAALSLGQWLETSRLERRIGDWVVASEKAQLVLGVTEYARSLFSEVQIAGGRRADEIRVAVCRGTDVVEYRPNAPDSLGLPIRAICESESQLVSLNRVEFRAPLERLDPSLEVRISIKRRWWTLEALLLLLASGGLIAPFTLGARLRRLEDEKRIFALRWLAERLGFERSSCSDAEDFSETLAAFERGVDRFLQTKVEQERELAAGKLALQMAHDLKSPLAAIKALRSGSGNKLDGDEAELLDHAVARLQELLGNLLQRPRPANSTEAAARLRECLQGTARRFEKSHPEKCRVEVVCEISEAPVAFNAILSEPSERAAFESVLWNLLQNGLEAADGDRAAALTVRASTASGGGLQIDVEDSGAGFSSQVLAAGAPRGLTTKGQGNGFGLSGAREWVEGHGGVLRISNLSQGARVSCVWVG